MTAQESLIVHLETCRAELDKLGDTVDLLHDHHNPDAVDWALVGSFAHLAELLTEARQFIRNEEAS